MMAWGKIGAKASGPTGSMVAGLSGGSSGKGRSGTRLYQLSGMAFSSRRNFVRSTMSPVLVAVSDQPSAYSFSGCRVGTSLAEQHHRISDRPLAGRVRGIGHQLLAYGHRRRPAAVAVNSLLGAQSVDDGGFLLEAGAAGPTPEALFVAH